MRRGPGEAAGASNVLNDSGNTYLKTNGGTMMSFNDLKVICRQDWGMKAALVGGATPPAVPNLYTLHWRPQLAN